MNRPLKIFELCELIEEGIAECENEVKNNVLEALKNYGAEETSQDYLWKDIEAIDVVREIIAKILETISEDEATEEQLEMLKKLNCRFIRLGRFCKENDVDE